MVEFLYECFALVNLPFTVLLILVAGYWLMVFLGAVGMETFDVDFDADFETDFEFDADADLDAEIDGAAGGEGWMISILRFFHIGEVPVMIVLSFVIVSMWTISMVTNHYLNADNIWWITLIWLLPNLLLSLFITKLATLPLRSVFHHLDAGAERKLQIVGKTCLVKTLKATPVSGQAELRRDDGVPLLLNIKTRDGESLMKGDAAKIIHHDEETGVYTVEKFDPEK